MVAQSTLQTPRNGQATQGAGRRYSGPFNKLKRHERGYRRLALVSAILLAGVLTVLLLELTGYMQP